MDKEKQKEIQKRIETKRLEKVQKIRASLIVIGYILHEFELSLQAGIPESIDISKFIKDYGGNINKTAIDFYNYCTVTELLDEDILYPLVSIIQKEEE